MNPGEEHRWSDIRQQAIDLFGDTPGAQLEQDILEHFADDPDRVIRTIHRIAQAEGVLSKWAVVRADLNRGAQADIVASNTKGRQRLVDNAKRWIDNAGLHYDREDHVLADLFGDEWARGPLTPYADDQQLRAELVAYWHSQRPRGEQAERDHITWNETAKANRAILLERKRTKETECQTTGHTSASSPSSSKPPTTSSETRPSPTSSTPSPSELPLSPGSTDPRSRSASPTPEPVAVAANDIDFDE